MKRYRLTIYFTDGTQAGPTYVDNVRRDDDVLFVFEHPTSRSYPLHNIRYWEVES